MSIFAYLIQRPEARNMIQTLFLGKTDYDKWKRNNALPDFIADVVAAVRAVPGDRGDPVVLAAISEAVLRWRNGTSDEALRAADYGVVKETGYPAYLGGPFNFAVRGFD
jgi:3-hydroxyacyl-CoA dehydrogenase/enoyl-CoA hydratase/3-hydroxybutyryl-CoA epimerase